MRDSRISERSSDVDNRWGSTMAAFPVPERIKLVIALSQLDPLESTRHCASMRNPARIVHESRRRLFPEKGTSPDIPAVNRDTSLNIIYF